MQSFLDVTLPPLLLAFFGCALTVIAGILAAARIRLWAAQRRRITGTRRALTTARDALAAVIADPAASAGIRDQAITAYQQVTEITTAKENHLT